MNFVAVNAMYYVSVTMSTLIVVCIAVDIFRDMARDYMRRDFL